MTAPPQDGEGIVGEHPAPTVERVPVYFAHEATATMAGPALDAVDVVCGELCSVAAERAVAPSVLCDHVAVARGSARVVDR